MKQERALPIHQSRRGNVPAYAALSIKQTETARICYAGKTYGVLDASPALFAAWVKQQLPDLARADGKGQVMSTAVQADLMTWARDEDRDSQARLLARWYVLDTLLHRARRCNVTLPLALDGETSG